MNEQVQVLVLTPAGETAGYFINPKVEMILPHHYKLTGTFHDHDGGIPHRVEFNPEVLPYHLELKGIANCHHLQLECVYVQRSRQPVEMVGKCQSQESVSNY